MLRTSPSRPWRRSASALSTLALAAVGVIAATPAMADEADDGGREIPAVAAEFAGEMEVEVTGASAQDGLELSASGTGFADLPESSLGTPAAGFYLALVDTSISDAELNADQDLATALQYVRPTAVSDGAWSTSLVAGADQLDRESDYEVVSWVAHGFLTEDTELARAPITLSDDQLEALFPGDAGEGPGDGSGEGGTDGTDAPETTVAVTAASATDGLTVAVSGSGYVDLPDAEGADGSAKPAMGFYAAIRDAATQSYEDINASTSALALTWIMPQQVRGGAWATELSVPAGELPEAGDFELLTWSAHGNLTEATLIDTAPITLSDDQLEALFPGDAGEGPGDGSGEGGTDGTDAPETTVAVTAASATDGLTVAVSGSGYVDLPDAEGADGSAKPAMGFYAAIRDAATQSYEDINASTSALALTWIMPQQVRDGAWATELSVPAGELPEGGDFELLTWSAHGSLTEATLIDTAPITLSDDQLEALFPAGPGEGGTPEQPGTTPEQPDGQEPEAEENEGPALENTAPVVTGKLEKQKDDGTVVTCTVETVQGSAGTPRLTWGVKSSFASYIEGGIAKGSISTAGGAARGGGGFTWGAGSGSLDASGAGTVTFPGSVHFSGHDGVLTTTVSNVRVKVTGARSGVLVADIASQDMEGNDLSARGVTFADLSFSSVSGQGGTASATLTAAGAKAFAGFYSAGESLDSLTLSVSGATADTTEEVCYDQDGNRVNADGTTYTGDGLAHTGLGGADDLIALVAGLTLAGAVLLLARARTTRRGSALRR
ncbi:HtaA domain-containing protein [Pseudactinotalea sp. HY158]|uniref:HtaA domain-containing protein n=1 Tax=Pseudactinotalea sp. HY158 TaxID=2654547 RepID=UPI00129CBCDA|nr:HtaA domain-containing protein [Pseudactinotalea sp. HY158]QGH68630.1 hypothetical protein GCE65_03240 [Pseudactinotalea sp. HY158]